MPPVPILCMKPNIQLLKKAFCFDLIKKSQSKNISYKNVSVGGSRSKI